MTRRAGLRMRAVMTAAVLAAVLIASKKCGGGYRPTPDRWLSEVRCQMSDVRGRNAGCIEGTGPKCTAGRCRRSDFLSRSRRPPALRG